VDVVEACEEGRERVLVASIPRFRRKNSSLGRGNTAAFVRLVEYEFELMRMREEKNLRE
jgi:hypothetical protein